MEFFLCFFFSLFPVPTPSFLSAITRKAKGGRKGGRKRKNKRERRNEKKKKKKRILNMVGNKKSFPERKSALGGNCFWSLKGER